MKVILLKNISGLGKEGDLVDAKDGYARNFLFPRKAAIEANPENLAKWKEDKKEAEARERQNIKEAQELKKVLEKNIVHIEAKGGEKGRLFGAITSADIGKRLEEEYKIEVDKRKIELKDNIKQAGEYKVPYKIYQGVVADLRVHISVK
ncbi:50S ribosomal protein L9 [Peptoniphilus sp. GNH]|nr:50S ribosomal protein L9 [Peptoniphilus sp. GNH]